MSKLEDRVRGELKDWCEFFEPTFGVIYGDENSRPNPTIMRLNRWMARETMVINEGVVDLTKIQLLSTLTATCHNHNQIHQ